MQEFDVIIVGGALSGSVLALALSSATAHRLRVAIVEKQSPNFSEQGGFDARSIALAQGSLHKMAQIQPLAGEHLGEVLTAIATPIREIHVSDQGHFGKVVLRADELSLPQLGAVVELANFGRRLQQCIALQPNITCFCPDHLISLERHPSHCHVTLQQGGQLRGRLLVAADGIQSELAAQCGVLTQQQRDYAQSAIIANVEANEAHQGRAFERFTTQGPLALLPLSEQRLSLVWCVRSPEALMALSESDFLHALQTQFGWTLGKLTRLSKRFVYPLTLQKAERHIHHRLAIVGNAAQQLHPVAGQGFNLGMRDLFTLSEIVAQAFKQGDDPGAFTYLHRFEKTRQADQTRLLNATSGLISLFCTENPLFQVGRNLGLFGLAHCQNARHRFVQQAIG